MKKYISFIILLSACFLMGCSSGIELTDEENNLVAEYMAGALLKYDHYYEEKLIVKKEADETKDVTNETKTDNLPNETNKETNDNSDSNDAKSEETKKESSGSYVSLADVFAGKDYTIAYKGSKICESYPKDNDAYVVEAPQGKRLAVIFMTINNLSAKTKEIDLSKEGISYVLEAGSKTYNNPLVTGIPNGIQFFKETIQSSKRKEAILIFDVDSKTKLNGGSLTVSMDGKTAKITLK